MYSNRNGDSQSDRIDIKDADAVNYWCKELNTTEAQLLEAVSNVGTSIEEIKKCFGNHPGTSFTLLKH